MQEMIWLIEKRSRSRHFGAMADTDDSAELKAQWDAVIQTRVEEMAVGMAKLIPLDEVEAEMDEFVAGLASSRSVVVTHELVKRQFKASARQRRKLGQVVPAEPYFVSPEDDVLVSSEEW